MSPGKPVYVVRARGGAYIRTVRTGLQAAGKISKHQFASAARHIYFPITDGIGILETVSMALGWIFIPEEMSGENPSDALLEVLHESR
jgi:hypothetical protein